MSITFEDIKRVNGTIKTIPIKGKEYAQVPERIKAFRMLFPTGSIRTEIVSLEGGVCVMRATCGAEDADGVFHVLGTGTAYEKEGASQINRTSYIENCETSAVGRALGMAGFGVDVSVASAEELQNAILQQEKQDKADEAALRRTMAEVKAEQEAELKAARTERTASAQDGAPSPLSRKERFEKFKAASGMDDAYIRIKAKEAAEKGVTTGKPAKEMTDAEFDILMNYLEQSVALPWEG